MHKTLVIASALMMTLGFAGGAAAGEAPKYSIGMDLAGMAEGGGKTAPVDVDLSGIVEISTDGDVRRILTSDGGPIDAVITVQGYTMRVQGELTGEEVARDAGDGTWVIEYVVPDGVYDGLESLEVSGTILEGEDGTLSVDLSGFAVFEGDSYNLDLAGSGNLDEAPRANWQHDWSHAYNWGDWRSHMDVGRYF